MTVVACANRGCGKSFDSNSVQGCQFHPGGPIFHDALKGWSCCNKRVVEFDAFLKIPGCTTGLHSTSISELPKPEREQAPVPPSESTSVDNGKVGKVTEKFTTSAIEKPKAEEVKKVPESDLNDPIDAEIEIGAKCKRPACGLPYENESSRTQQCIYHSGAPVFHEGSKGWSCCTRKVLDFNDFLKIKGCKTGLHRFTDIQPVGPVVVNCRRDWYQTQDKVIISIFAKKVDKNLTTINLFNEEMQVDITFEDGSTHKYHTALFQPILVPESTFNLSSAKIEIILKKANGYSWASIEPNQSKF